MKPYGGHVITNTSKTHTTKHRLDAIPKVKRNYSRRADDALQNVSKNIITKPDINNIKPLNLKEAKVT